MSVTIREYETRDRVAAERCLAVLQDFERAFESDRVESNAMCIPYLNFLLSKCESAQGKMFVAEVEGEVIGFSSVWIDQGLDDFISDRKPVAYLSDSVVVPAFRDKGIGTSLLRVREDYARSLGVKNLKVEVLWKNAGMREFVTAQGFREYGVSFVKHLK